MRIAIYGAAGTGKTTLAKMIEEELGVPFNPVGSRFVAASMGFDNPYDVDKAGKRAEFQRRLVAEKVAWEAAHESFVTDRTTFDNIAYTILHDVHAIDESLMAAAFEGFLKYDKVIFCPMRAFWALGDDPARMKSKVYHELYEAVVCGLVDKATDARIDRECELGEYTIRNATCFLKTREDRLEWVRVLKLGAPWRVKVHAASKEPGS